MPAYFTRVHNRPVYLSATKGAAALFIDGPKGHGDCIGTTVDLYRDGVRGWWTQGIDGQELGRFNLRADALEAIRNDFVLVEEVSAR